MALARTRARGTHARARAHNDSERNKRINKDKKIEHDN